MTKGLQYARKTRLESRIRDLGSCLPESSAFYIDQAFQCNQLGRPY